MVKLRLMSGVLCCRKEDMLLLGRKGLEGPVCVCMCACVPFMYGGKGA